MSRFERQQVLQSIANPAAGEAQATMALADTLQAFGDYGMKKYAEMRVDEATQEAQAVEPRVQAPELRDKNTLTGEAYNKVVMAGHAAAIKNDYTRRIKELELEHPDDPVSFQNKLEAYSTELLNGVSPEVRNAVALDIDQTSIAPMLRARQRHEERTVNESVAGIIESADIFSDELANAARDGDLQGVQHNEAAIDEIVNTLEEMGRFDLARKYRNAIDERVDKQIALGQAEKAIASGNGAAYIQSFIDNPPADLTPEQVDSYSATMITMNNRHISLEKQQQAAVSIETSRSISNLKIAAQNGLGDPEQLMDQTEKYFDAKLISESERTSIMNDIISADIKAAEQAEVYSDIAKRLEGDSSMVVDPTDQDDFWDEVLAPQIENMDPVAAEVATVNYVNRMKRVPKGLKAKLETYVMSNDIELMTEAVRIVDKVDQVPGLVDDVFPSHQKAFIKNAVALAQTMDPREAVNEARKLTDPANKARIEAKESEIKDMRKGMGALDYRSEVQKIFDPWGPGGITLDTLHQDQIAKEYQFVFETYFKNGMSKSDAMDEAEKKVKRNWSEWQGQAIKYSPDNYYSVAGSTDYVKDQLYSDAGKQFMFEDMPKKKELVLISTERTARTASTGRPVYNVGVKRNGSLQIIEGFLWYPDMDKEIKRVERANKKLADSAKESIKHELPAMESL